ncbi:peptidase [Anoxybacter fermentans]|uniref:Peptidase n=1 Tax=Anoxybacter fermentans TaxID=1323375 RepID=A0A3S9SXM3_9FIRM|nr:zinc metallopeptidase [Anoxybacter fermentans]AZR72964.1 peptidase [Anoxybacter fermentans]
MYYPIYDSTWIIVLPAIILVMWAQYKVKSTFYQYLQVPNRRGYTGAQVARDILDRAGLHHVRVERISGELTDHYDPRSEVVRLSPQVYDGCSLASLGVAAHETGHALQHAENYVPLGFRNAIFPIANIGSRWGLPLALFGFIFFRSPDIILLGVLLYAGAVLFQIATLPVEFNASSRAMAILESGGYLSQDELKPTRKVLNAAALTYVAAALAAIAQLIRLLALFGMSRREE